MRGERNGYSHCGSEAITVAGDCGSGPAIFGVPVSQKFSLQLGTRPDTKYLEGVWGRAKNSGNYVRVMGSAVGGHPTELVPWSLVQGNLRNHTRGPDIANNVQRGGRKHGPTLAVHDIGV